MSSAFTFRVLNKSFSVLGKEHAIDGTIGEVALFNGDFRQTTTEPKSQIADARDTRRNRHARQAFTVTKRCMPDGCDAGKNR